jgi:hypothetical protein
MCHALFGIIAVSLLWLQPIGAMFRCSPSHNARKWFYYSHKAIGILAWVLSGVKFFSTIPLPAFSIYHSRPVG